MTCPSGIFSLDTILIEARLAKVLVQQDFLDHGSVQHSSSDETERQFTFASVFLAHRCAARLYKWTEVRQTGSLTLIVRPEAWTILTVPALYCLGGVLRILQEGEFGSIDIVSAERSSPQREKL